METKRINLCFNLENNRAKEAYESIQGQTAKTAFVIDAVLAYIGTRDGKLYKETVKEGFKEVIEELGLEIDMRQSKKKNKENSSVPDDIFDMITRL